MYLHKIFIYEEYRSQGMGTLILKKLCENDFKITLVCQNDKSKNPTLKGQVLVTP